MVFTEQYHRKRGYCCESGCRHCPYGFNAKQKSLQKPQVQAADQAADAPAPQEKQELAKQANVGVASEVRPASGKTPRSGSPGSSSSDPKN
jgi:hypothetical protein